MMRSISGTILLLCLSNFCLAATSKHSEALQTDFKTMTAEQALALLQHAESIHVNAKDYKRFSMIDHDIAFCNGKKMKDSPDIREKDCRLWVQGNLRDPLALQFDMSVLFRGCGVWAPSSRNDESNDGSTCGLLGRLFYAIGNVSAARAIWENARGCWAIGSGQVVNGCIRYIVKSRLGMTAFEPDLPPGLLTDSSFGKDAAIDAYRDDPNRLIRMATVACNPAENLQALPKDIQGAVITPDVSACGFLAKQGVGVDVRAARKAEYAAARSRLEQDQEIRQRAAERPENDARFNAVMSALGSMPGSSDPNAIVNSANQQGAQMVSIGAANDAARKAGRQQVQPGERISGGQPQTSTAVSQQSASASNGVTAMPSSPVSQAQTAHYEAALPSSCIVEFWDPKYYNWLSFQNNCGQAVYVSWIAVSPSDKFGFSSATLVPGGTVNSGWSQNEVQTKGGFLFEVCPASYLPVDTLTDRPVSRASQEFRCKQQ